MKEEDRNQRLRELFDLVMAMPIAEKKAYLEKLRQSDVRLHGELTNLLNVNTSNLEELGQTPLRVEDLYKDWPGRFINQYELESLIGHGGMGVVFKAIRHEDDFQQTVALKIVPGIHSSEILMRFKKEQQILASLNHPYIAKLLDGGASKEGQLFIAMELVEGKPITQYCREEKLSLKSRLNLFCQVCEAVGYAHDRLIIHRDIKPDNILVDAHGNPKLLDFGIAKLLDASAGGDLTQEGSKTTPQTTSYASPEQLTGIRATVPSDVFSLGILFYEILLGRHPFFDAFETSERLKAVILSGKTHAPSAMLRQLKKESVKQMRPRRDLVKAIPKDVDRIILKALKPDPQERYQNMSSMRQDIERYLEGKPVEAQGPGTWYRLKKFFLRNRVYVSVTTLFLLTISGFLYSLWQKNGDILRERHKVEETNAFLLDLFKASDPKQALGEDLTAKQILSKGLEKVQNDPNIDPEFQVSLLETMGSIYLNLGSYQKAHELLDQALGLSKTVFGETHENTAIITHDVGHVLLELGDYDAAETHLRRSLEVFTKLYGDHHPQVDKGNSSLGSALFYQGKLDEAESLIEKSLIGNRQRYGEAHITVADAMNTLGAIDRNRGDYPAALSNFEKALGIYEKLLDPLHPSISITLGNMGWTYGPMGEHEKAENHFRRVLAIREKVLGFCHPNLGFTLNNLASTLQRRVRFKEAERYFREAIQLFQMEIGNLNPTVATLKNNLGLLLEDMGEYEAADALLEEAFRLRLLLLTPPNADLAKSLGNLAGSYQRRGFYEKAEAYYCDSLDMRMALWGLDHHQVARGMNNLGFFLLRQNRFKEAESYLEMSLAAWKSIHGLNHFETLNTQCNLAEIRFRRGSVSESERLLREVLTVAGDVVSEDHWLPFHATNLLGQCLISSKDFQGAEALLTSSFSVLKTTENAKRAQYQAFVKTLIALYGAWGQPEKAQLYKRL